MAGIQTYLRSALRESAYEILKDYFEDYEKEKAPIIFSHNNGSEPSTSYVVINILNSNQVGRSDLSTLTDPQENIVIQSYYEVLVQFSFLGSESADMALSLHNRLSGNPVTLEALAKQNLGYMRKTQVRRLPEKRETSWIEKSNFDVTFTYFINTIQEVGVVDTVILLDSIRDKELQIPPSP